MTSTYFKSISSLEAFLLLMVLFIHSDFTVLVYVNEPRVNIFIDFLNFFNANVLSFIVPTFFLISGFLFFRNGVNLTVDDYKQKYKSRLKTLVIPYLLWNFIGMAVFLIKLYSPLRQFFPQYNPADFQGFRILVGFWQVSENGYPFDMPLWFLRDLIIFQLLCPLIEFILKRCGFISSAIFALPLILAEDAVFQRYAVDFFYFSLGAVISAKLKNGFLSDKHTVLAALLYAIMVTISYLAPDHLYITVIKIACGALMISKIAMLLGRANVFMPEFTIKSSFFVYAFHGLFVSVINKLVTGMLPPTSNLAAFADYIAVFALLYCISGITYVTMKKLAPKPLSILTGSR